MATKIRAKTELDMEKFRLRRFVEAQHAVVLGQALELDAADYLPPFETDAAALDPADFPVAG